LQFAPESPLSSRTGLAWRVLLDPSHEDPMSTLRGKRGAIEATRWLELRRLDASNAPHWYVEIDIPSNVEGMIFELRICQKEWGFVFRTPTRVSSIRVTDEPFVHGPDDLNLLSLTPRLDRIGDLLEALQKRFQMSFRRARAAVRSNFARATAIVRLWLATTG
jgi:hypothetical protein